MSDEIELAAIDGTNPLGFLAALGVLDALHRAGKSPTLRWTDDLVPMALVSGVADADGLVAVLETDRARWPSSVVLNGPSGARLDDAKPASDVLSRWAAEVVEAERANADLFAALVSEGGVDGKGNGKPTHLHFTAGQQKFLTMVRELAANVSSERLSEALFGPWREDSPLPSLSWSSHGERLYALRAVNPATDKRLGVPGADWLAFLGLVFFPTCVTTRRDGVLALRTSGCDQPWKRSALRWPLWTIALDRDTTWSLVGDSAVVGDPPTLTPATLRGRGILRVLTAPIRRSDQGGYGSFGGASVLVEAT